MPLALKIFLFVTGLLLAVVVLSFIGPLQSENKFWRIIIRLRDGIDLFSYWTINILAISAIVATLGMIAYKLLT